MNERCDRRAFIGRSVGVAAGALAIRVGATGGPVARAQERVGAWVAQVRDDTLDLLARPFGHGEVRRVATRGDLLRVVGVAPGLEGDARRWVATTEGYVQAGAIEPAEGEQASSWGVPDGAEATRGWWGELKEAARVRVVGSSRAPSVGALPAGTRVKVLDEEQGEAIEGDPRWYRIDGGRFAGGRVHASLVARMAAPRPNLGSAPTAAPNGVWLVVDRAASTLTLVHEGRPELVTYVSLGNAGTDTPAGHFETFAKARTDDMSSLNVPGAARPYYLPDVPCAQYYARDGAAIHGTYWHDRFGFPESQGCINLTWGDAAFVFNRSAPTVPDGRRVQWATMGQGTPVQVVD